MLIVGIFSVYNGRATRKLIIEEEKRAQEMFEGIKDVPKTLFFSQKKRV